MVSEYTGPVAVPKEIMDKWYHRMKDILNPVQRSQYGIACHPDDHDMMIDMLERLIEDDTWPHDEVPGLITSALMKRGEIRPFDPKTMRVVSMADVNKSTAGFGRFGGLLLPGKGGELHDPWKEGAASDSRKKIIRPD